MASFYLNPDQFKDYAFTPGVKYSVRHRGLVDRNYRVHNVTGVYERSGTNLLGETVHVFRKSDGNIATVNANHIHDVKEVKVRK